MKTWVWDLKNALTSTIPQKVKRFEALYKTNRFHVAVGLFSNRSQRTSKCGKNNSGTRAAVFTTFWRHLWSITEQTHGNMESICWIIQRFSLRPEVAWKGGLRAIFRANLKNHGWRHRQFAWKTWNVFWCKPYTRRHSMFIREKWKRHK